MDESQKKFLNALNLAFSPNPGGVIKILSSFSLDEVFKLGELELRKLGFREETILNFLKRREKINAEKEWQRLKKENIKLITKDEEEYPALLKEIAQPPAALYIKGKLLPSEIYFASVGTRYPSDYGKMIAPDLVGEICQNFTVVSGMARGIDTLSHKACLVRKKRTVAVVGTGLDIIFPPENKKLAKEIELEGALISEFPLGAPSLGYNFPLRNRIIAGMSVGTLVIEGKRTSGSLITANFALEEGREVFAVPGPIFSKTSEGPNYLIKEGAHPVTEANDILAVFNLEKAMAEEKEIKGETEEENIILAILKEGAVSIDEIIKKTKLEPGKINSTLILMEIQGKIKRSGTIYMINRE
jgi:DNA processing protein